MKAFAQVLPLLHTGILTFLLCLLLLWFFLLSSVLERTQKRRKKHPAQFLALLLPLLIFGVPLLLTKSWVYTKETGQPPLPGSLFFANLPVWVFAAVLFCGYALAIFGLFREKTLRKENITKSAIKQSTDNLPAGLCFAAESGLILLANKTMESLCHRLSGQDLQDAEVFWQMLTGGRFESATRLSDGQSPTLRFADGKTWTFARRTIAADRHTVNQITAVDTTDLDRLHRRLQQDNAALAEMGQNLARYMQDVTKVKAQEERLATKMRIHDEIGYVLLASRRLLELRRSGGEAAGHEIDGADALFALWKRSIEAYEGDGSGEKPAVLKPLADAADALGVRLRITGALPEQEGASALILAIAGECLHNAVRHARATELSLAVSSTAETCTAVFSNNGNPPAGEIVEGGGLSTVRRKVEKAKGTMTVAHRPHFSLTVTLPKERGA